MKPLIGITAGTVYNHKFPYYPFTYGQMHTYAEAVTAAGGTPVILPIGTVDSTPEILARLDGILFAGGNDIAPKLYGQKAQYIEERGSDDPRDAFEVALMKHALKEHVPILAICRGMQLLNVVHGGTLYQDIAKQVPEANNHLGRLIVEDFLYSAHELTIAPESKLAGILDRTKIKANSHHHQAVHEVGDKLLVSARAEDGMIEGIESTDDDFVIGVQPHPEALVSIPDSEWKPLFAAFVTAASRKITKRPSTKK